MESLEEIDDQLLIGELKDRGYSVIGKKYSQTECSNCGGKMYYTAEVFGDFHFYKVGTRCENCMMFVGTEGHFD
ncbi:hypothetical protein [Methanococcoides vulcani]|nr:hypothetical protein [Methanococcoides vulcani]